MTDALPGTAAGALHDALGTFTAALLRLWASPDFPQTFYVPDRSYARDGTRAVVRTVAEAGAARLPHTRRPVRGTPDVELRVYGDTVLQRDRTAEGCLRYALEESGRRYGAPADAPVPPAWADVVAARAALAQTLLAVPRLGTRAADAGAINPRRLSLPRERSDLGIAREWNALRLVHDETERALAALGVGTADECRVFAASPTAPDALRLRLAGQLDELAALATDRYLVTAYLNGPPVDADEPLLLLDDFSYGLAHGAVHIAAATDDDLAAAAEAVSADRDHRLPPGLHACNAVVTFPFEVGIDVAGDELVGIYEAAVAFSRAVLDAFRLVRADDLGLSFVFVRPLTPYAPTLPVAGWAELQPGAAGWSARRQAFGAPSPEPFSAEELAAVAALVPRTAWPPEVKGLAVATRRFRDAYERYGPDDPERLLDMAIALEAVLLNDNDVKEQLRFRTALRAARLTEDAVEARTAVFRTVRDLYDLRSKIAHGDTAESLGRGPARRLAALQRDAPAAVRAVLRAMYDGRGPTGLSGDALRAWWTRLELA